MMLTRTNLFVCCRWMLQCIFHIQVQCGCIHPSLSTSEQLHTPVSSLERIVDCLLAPNSFRDPDILSTSLDMTLCFLFLSCLLRSLLPMLDHRPQNIRWRTRRQGSSRANRKQSNTIHIRTQLADVKHRMNRERRRKRETIRSSRDSLSDDEWTNELAEQLGSLTVDLEFEMLSRQHD